MDESDIEKLKGTYKYQCMLLASKVLNLKIDIYIALMKYRIFRSILLKPLNRMLKQQKKYLEYQCNPYSLFDL